MRQKSIAVRQISSTRATVRIVKSTCFQGLAGTCIIYLLSRFVPQIKLLIELVRGSKYSPVHQYNSFLLFFLCLSTTKRFKTGYYVGFIYPWALQYILVTPFGRDDIVLAPLCKGTQFPKGIRAPRERAHAHVHVCSGKHKSQTTMSSEHCWRDSFLL